MSETTDTTTDITTAPSGERPADGTALEAPAPEGGEQRSTEEKPAGKAELAPEVAEKISKANREAANLRKRLKELEPKAKKWDEAEAANRTESEQLGDQLAKAEARAKAAITSAVNAEIRAAAHGWANPGDAPRYLDDKDRYIGDDGEIDRAAIAEDVAAVLKDRPYLASTSDKGRRGPSPDPGQGARGQASIDEQIRAAERKGDHREALRLKTAQLLASKTR